MAGVKATKKRRSNAKGKAVRTKGDTRCWWCGVVLPFSCGQEPDGEGYWSGWSPDCKEVWPSAGVHVCGPDCPERPSHSGAADGLAPIRKVVRPDFTSGRK